MQIHNQASNVPSSQTMSCSQQRKKKHCCCRSIDRFLIGNLHPSWKCMSTGWWMHQMDLSVVKAVIDGSPPLFTNHVACLLLLCGAIDIVRWPVVMIMLSQWRLSSNVLVAWKSRMNINMISHWCPEKQQGFCHSFANFCYLGTNTNSVIDFQGLILMGRMMLKTWSMCCVLPFSLCDKKVSQSVSHSWLLLFSLCVT